MIVGDSVAELIGQTPVVKLRKMTGPADAEVYVKLENFNPGGSIKDRIALSMIKHAEEAGLLKPGATIVEPTSGNTGIGLAMLAAAWDYHLILVMPETMSLERRSLLKAYGAEIELTPGTKGMAGAISRAQQMVKEIPGAFMPQQFDNPANPQIHRETTAREIIAQAGGQLDAFVSAVGTGGTITGIGEILKQTYPQVKIVAVEPSTSPVISGGRPGANRIQGIGAGFIPKVLNTQVLDEIIPVSYEDAVAIARLLVRKEGLLLGMSSGAAVYAGLEVARKLGPGKKVFVIAPDTGERYLSTELFHH